MTKIFHKDGTLIIPDTKKEDWQTTIVKKHKTFVKAAYCPKGHNLMSDVKIDDHKGIHFLYREKKTNREADIVITALVGDSTKVYLKGEPFDEGDIVAIYCPICKTELLPHGDCECGTHDYMFFLDEKLAKDCAQTFCSRIGCVQASKLHVAEDEDAVVHKEEKAVVTEAYCPNGHSLISDIKIDHHKGIHLICEERETNREAEVVVTATVGQTHKIILKGEPFEEGQVVNVSCPTCREKLPILFDCECGAPIYMFFLDKNKNYNYGQSFCSRMGCVKSSRLQLSEDMLREFMERHCT
ncbi:MAG: hypothetical protein GY737_06630 [Desulfobacteraceae bacterium]|nr:hypothetical protein [Desulfobacteraceae bacterium]